MADRRTPGLSAFSRNTITSAQYASHGSQLRHNHASSLQAQMSVFQSLLHQFSISHAKDIRSNPQFRTEFARMCNAIGVDPLLSSSAGRKSSGEGGSLWAKMLGGSVNDFYFDLAVLIVQICRETRAENGGMISLSEVRMRISKMRQIGRETDVSEDDIVRAVKTLDILGSGFTLTTIGSKQMIRSVPKELNADQSIVLEAMQLLGNATISMLQVNLGWGRARCVAVIDDLIRDGLIWVDSQAEETEYWGSAGIGGG